MSYLICSKFKARIPTEFEFRLLAREFGPDLPANLLWVQLGSGGHGHVITGNVSNLLAAARWDPTDAVLALPLEPAAAEALRKSFDNAHARSRPLTKETAAARVSGCLRAMPRASGCGGSISISWMAGTTACPGKSSLILRPARWKVLSSRHLRKQSLPRPDPVLLAVQTVLAKGSVVAVDQSSRAPPLSAPVKAEFFGERGDIRSGAARRLQRFSVSLFDEDTTRRLGRARPR